MYRNSTRCLTPTAWNVQPRMYKLGTEMAASMGYGGNKMIEFLCSKNIWNSGAAIDPSEQSFVPKEERRFQLLTSPPNDFWKQRQTALCDIVGVRMPPEKRWGAKPASYKAVTKSLSFANFVKKNPKWSKGKAYVVFRDHPHLAGPPIQRVQIFGTCALHAPITLQHYLVAMGRKERSPTLNMQAWLRKLAPAVFLENVVFGKGHHAIDVLPTLLEPGTQLHPVADPLDIPHALQIFGPGLIGRWSVEPSFSKGTKLHYQGQAELPTVADLNQGMNSAPLHAMLVVGYRGEDSDLRLLLQNWWETKQFIEVDCAYYAACCSHTTFVKTPQTMFPEKAGVTQNLFEVCAADGAGVCPDWSWSERLV